MKKNKLAVIILNYNDYKNTIRYIKDIQKYEIIDKIVIVDNVSPDNSYEKLKKYSTSKIDVIKTEKNNGYAYGNNYAIKYLNEKYEEFQYIAISNPDVEVSEISYKKCINFLDKNKDVAIAAPRMYDINNTPHPLSGWKIRTLKGDIIDSSPALSAYTQKYHIERYDEKHFKQNVSYVDCVAGSFFIIRNKVFREVGYFDENTFLYYEEDILATKLKSLGYKNVILNTCKFNHYESVSVDKSINSKKKFKTLQKSKRYYHLNYNPELKGIRKVKILFLDFVTIFRPIEDKLHIDRLALKIRGLSFSRFGMLFFKLMLFFIQILLLPISYITKKFRKRKKVLYFSLVTWKWIKQRPHFVALELSKKYDVDYRYQTLYDKYMPKNQNNLVQNDYEKKKNFNVKPFKIFPANTKRNITLNKLWCYIRTSFWNYDKIILTHPNQIDFFFMTVQKMKKVEFYYEAMDNYEAWELDKEGYRDKQGRLLSVSKKLIVSADKLKNKLVKLYGLKEDMCVVVRNGYDDSLFKKYKNVDTNFKHPNICYIGTVDDWFDFKSVSNYAKKYANVQINIIGPINPAVEPMIKKIKQKNLIFHGPIEHNMVPKHIEDSDVMIMPFLINDVIEYVDPVKVYEYLYMKKPVVCSYWDELEQFNGMVCFYKKTVDFENVINKALKMKFKENDKYKKIMKDSTWNNRLKKYLNAIEERM